jgi:hypothetical protein
MYYNSNFGFLNSFNNDCVIFANVLGFPSGVVLGIFMYQTSMHPLKVVANYTIFAPSWWTLFVVQMVSHMNRSCSRSSNPIPLTFGNLSVLSTLSILYV